MRYKVLIPKPKTVKMRGKTTLHIEMTKGEKEPLIILEVGDIEGNWTEFDIPDDYEYVYDRRKNTPGTFLLKIINGDAYTFPVPQKA